MVSIAIYISTVIFFIGVVLGQRFWYDKRIDKLENVWKDERDGYIDTILSKQQEMINTNSLLNTYNGAAYVYEDKLPPELRGDLN